MNQLWVRLSLAFGGVILLSFLVVTVLSATILRANAEHAFVVERERITAGLAAQLAAYYEQNGSWAGVNSLFDGANASSDFFFPDGFVLVDEATETPIYGELLPDTTVDERVPVVTSSGVSAVLLVGSPPKFPMRAPENATFLFRNLGLEEVLLMFAFVGVVISLLFGIILSRGLTNPLDELVLATKTIGAGNLDHRMKEKGPIETVTLAKSFNNMVSELQKAEALRRNLVADVAHELRTPIAALQANLYAILDDAYPMTKTEIAGLYEQTRTLSRLVNDLHEVAQAEAKQLPLHRQAVDLGTALPEMVAPFSIVAESKEIAFEIHTTSGLPRVNVDMQRIGQVVNNLLSNALRHTPEGGTISVAVERGEGQVQIVIRDTGEGIAAEHLPHVFDRFYRADHGRSRDMGGTGLGLAIAKAIVEAHSGTISAESTVGSGTTMRVLLPAAA
jgi:signal transduction histidine kinase